MGDTFPATEDWDNEEWSGSLSDTKVFTPSVNPQPAMDGDAPQLPVTTEDWEAPEPPVVAEGHIPTYTYHNPAVHHVNMEPGAPEPPAPHLAPDAFLHQHQHQPLPVQPRGMSGSLSAAQSQYLEQLTQQSQRHDTSVYTTNYGVYGAAEINPRKQRARVPPPSKIPRSAVEMPGGGEGALLDVQFGALDDLPDPHPHPHPHPHQHPHTPKQGHAMPPAPAPAEPAPAPLEPAPHADPTPVSYNNANAMLPESLPPTEPPAPAPAPEPVVTNSTSSLEKQLTASMKQLSVSAAETPPMHLHLQQHRPKPPSASTNASVNATGAASAAGAASASGTAAGAAQTMYSHHQAPHAPPAVYSGNVYAPQVNSSNASLSAAALPPAYPSSVTLTQYQPILNSYQSSSPAGAAAGAYSSSALYTAAQYSPYQPPAAAAAALPKHQPKEAAPQYDTSAAPVSNSLTSTSTTQTSTAKVTTTSGHVPVTGASSGGAAYAGGALYGSQGYAAYDEQLMRSTMPHHMGGYYEVTGYGVGVGGGARDAGFGLGGGERFARSDAASPQQVQPAALPPGYAYYYQPPPPTTYQYGVYPNVSDLRVQFGAGSGGAAAGKVPPAYQQQYEAQDSYKPGGGYSGSGNKAAAGAADLSTAMYAKGHVTLNKVNSYEKAGFHSGTPPPFGAASHLYIAAPHHHHHAPQPHQAESGSSGGRGGSNKPAHNKPAYTHSYWPTN